ncbi:MAG: hypothetical protein ACI4JY_01450 [Oscillospiraceae bacterium]
MPHSGGGGSHGGGHHSGGSHRSGSSGNSNRVSNTYFPRARRFMYYYRGRPHYYYARQKVTSDNKSSGIALIVFAVLWLLVTLPLIIAMSSNLFIPKPFQLNYDASIVIDDEIGIVESKTDVTNAILDFQEKTGVTVSIVTRTTENAYIGNTHENEAYNCYVERWDDEKHWLVYYVGDTKNRTDDWYWELMCGDDCLKILPTKYENQFTRDFHRYLAAYERYTFDEAFITALGSIEVKPGSVNPEGICEFLIVLIFPVAGVIILISGITTFIKALSPEEKAKLNAVEISVNKTPEEIVCPYCDSVYVKYTCTECPHCGAPLKTDTNSSDLN